MSSSYIAAVFTPFELDTLLRAAEQVHHKTLLESTPAQKKALVRAMRELRRVKG